MNKFEQLKSEDQREIITGYGPQLGFSEKVIEKDYWVCMVLDRLFIMPDSIPMAFKGGTSLSKGYDLIDRFSEDIDITLDFKYFAAKLDLGCDPFEDGISGNKRKMASDRIKEGVSQYIRNKVLPYFREVIKGLPSNRNFEVECQGQETLKFSYSSAFDKHSYIEETVLVEFGGRNFIIPNQTKVILPMLNNSVEGVEFVKAEVDILDPMRTFWEKITLVHVFCNKCLARKDPETRRMSRHWYDLYQMLRKGYGERANQELHLLKDVVALKNVFFRSAVSNYDECLEGRLRLIPETNCLKKLKDDYREMKGARMFYGNIPEFEEMVEKLQTFQGAFNQRNG